MKDAVTIWHLSLEYLPGCVFLGLRNLLLSFPPIQDMARKMRFLLILLVVAEVLAVARISLALTSTNDAYPSGYGDDSGACGVTGEKLVPVRREVYGNGRIFDITHRITSDSLFDGSEGDGKFVWLSRSMKNGSDYNFSIMKLPVHSGTHVDAPGHYFDHYFDAGFDVDTLDLDVLNGIITRKSCFSFSVFLNLLSCSLVISVFGLSKPESLVKLW